MTSPLQSWYQQQAAKLAFRRGLTHARQAAHSLAIAAFTQALEKGYRHPDQVLVKRGISQVQIGAREAAIADFEAVITPALQDQANSAESPAQPNFTLAQAYHYRGRLHQQVGNEAGALADWSAAIAHWPRYPEPHYHRALLYLSQGYHQQALADLNATLACDPTMVAAYSQRGDLRYQLSDISGAVADWTLAVCNDFSQEEVKQKLANIQQASCDAKLSAILQTPLADKGLTVRVNHSASQLDIHIYREVGTGVNYYTLPELIREHLVPLHLANVSRFQLVGHLAEVKRLEWNQSYDLYKGQPCPPSNWQAAFSTLVVFPPFGIPAFIQAAQVKRFYQQGQYWEALSASKAVKGLCVAGSVTLGFFTLLPLGYAAYDSMKETPTFRIVEQIEQFPERPYQKIWNSRSKL
ncbi:MAG: CD225/dispanin family protein [Phormidesmis sp.]